MKTTNITIVLIAALFGAVPGCEGANEGAGEAQVEEIASTSDALSFCPSQTRQLVCGTDGRTYTNLCRAGGLRRVAHVGACPGFVCNGVVCVAGFTCRTATNFGVPFDQCVSDTGAPPACTCAAGTECVVEPSGATRCTAPATPLAAPDPADLCAGKTCPAGLHCEVTTINFGVPAPSCMYD